MAEQLTPQQKMAITDRGGKLLVSAAAGSGKTKVLVDRLISYLTDPECPADIDEFLIITYTKAAASELRGKIADKLSERIAEDPGNRHLHQQVRFAAGGGTGKLLAGLSRCWLQAASRVRP